jgi:hypothetical protein
MEKLIIDGNVAILYSPGFGAGWSSWNYDHPECLFDPQLAQMIHDGAPKDDIQVFADLKYGDNVYTGCVKDLEIKWLKQGTYFRICENDGNETVETIETIDWIKA